MLCEETLSQKMQATNYFVLFCVAKQGLAMAFFFFFFNFLAGFIYMKITPLSRVNISINTQEETDPWE